MMRFIFWLGTCLLIIPACAGLVLGCAALTVVGLAAIILCCAIVAVGAILVVPLFVWCAYMDPTDWSAAKKFVRHGVDSLN